MGVGTSNTKFQQTSTIQERTCECGVWYSEAILVYTGFGSFEPLNIAVYSSSSDDFSLAEIVVVHLLPPIKVHIWLSYFTWAFGVWVTAVVLASFKNYSFTGEGARG